MQEQLIDLLHQNPINVTLYYHSYATPFHPRDIREINWDDLKSMIVELPDGRLFLWIEKEHALKEYRKNVLSSDRLVAAKSS